MDTRLAPRFKDDATARKAQELLRACVHCGFCTATCPTYQLLGDELDGPRGRIYLVRQLLETGKTSTQTSQHLDRCLLCRSCETTCPSGVEYHHLLHIGRQLSADLQALPLAQKAKRTVLKGILPWPRRTAPALKLVRLLRPMLPAQLRKKIPEPEPGSVPATSSQPRKVLLFQGCVQSVVAQNINNATRRVLERLNIECIEAANEYCCGAVHHHLNDDEKARHMARHNIDRWLPLLQEEAEALIITASACALEIKEYPQLLANDSQYQGKAMELLLRCQEIGEFLNRQELSELGLCPTPPMALHLSCTLQHGLKTQDQTSTLLSRLGFDIRQPADSHLCCGSAGTYSILQPELSEQLRVDKLAKLKETGAEISASTNIGCLLHLREKSGMPVKHWIEWLDEYLE